ncbi:Glucose-6-phosphate 1-epimerase isoform X1 [Oopsacas minuta]|uniref:glucose-6-phosphate 1-epimerase n=1 Tax=Oopsacas minuta TaxID=111878 RepID=A0AAV7JPX6_9METZ|nr:Glucose-6-phosphate 1-epimerase isoform X1 [Oopsacas minuta]
MASATVDDLVMLELDANNSVSVSRHGATVTSWRHKGEEILFLSSKAVFDNVKAIRGGVPICFPQFGPWDLGPQHGFARTARWSVYHPPTSLDEGTITAILELNDQQTDNAWGYKFTLLYSITLTHTTLELKVGVENNSPKPFDFTILLHPYFSVSNVEAISVTGFENSHYFDKNKDGAKFVQKENEVKITSATDKIFPNVIGPHALLDPNKNRVVVIHKENFPDTVVWNPWTEGAKKMSDFGDDEFAHMVCVEPGFVSNRVCLEPNQEFNASMTLSVEMK